MNPDIFRDVLTKVMTGNPQSDARIGRALDCGVAFGMWLAKTNQGGAEKLDAEQVAVLFFEKARTL